MNIGINLRAMLPKAMGGMEHYVRQLIKGIVVNTEHQVWLFLSETAYDTFDDIPDRQMRILLSRDAFEKDMLHGIQKYAIDVWFCPLLVLEPQFVPIPSVITIPDIQHEYYPENFSAEVLAWRKNHYLLSAKTAQQVLTLSDFSKQTMIEKYSIDSEKITAIPLDVGADFDCAVANEQFIHNRVVNFDKKFFLYPANAWPHKDHKTLIKAIGLVKKQYNDIQLVLTGVPDFGDHQIFTEIDKLGLTDNVKVLGHIAVADLKFLYTKATALVFPSLFEGFGIPVVEAMKTGCPVICSDSTSLPEVGGDAVLFFKAGNAEQLAAQIITLLEDESLASSLAQKGLLRGQQYSWKETVEKTIAQLENVASQKIVVQDFPKVTIITPSYNQGIFIKETIDSVLNQNYPNLEYIVVDGGSTDTTIDILKSYGNRITWVSEPDDGQADAVNKGLKMATGEIIGWLNSDDTYYPNAIQEAVHFLLLNQQVDVVYGDGMHIDKDGNPLQQYPSESFNWIHLSETCFICQPALFFRKSAIEKVSGLRKELQMCMDYDLWIRMGKVCNFAYVPSLWATSRMYNENKTLGQRNAVYTEIMKTVREHYDYLPLSWIYGYWHHRFNGKYMPLRAIISGLHLIAVNHNNWTRLRNDLKQAIKKIRH